MISISTEVQNNYPYICPFLKKKPKQKQNKKLQLILSYPSGKKPHFSKIAEGD